MAIAQVQCGAWNLFQVLVSLPQIRMTARELVLRIGWWRLFVPPEQDYISEAGDFGTGGGIDEISRSGNHVIEPVRTIRCIGNNPPCLNIGFFSRRTEMQVEIRESDRAFDGIDGRR